MSDEQSMALDGEEEFVKASGKRGKKVELSEAKAVAALKSHSDAEKRRRERINAHFETLRGLVLSNGKFDLNAEDYDWTANYLPSDLSEEFSQFIPNGHFPIFVTMDKATLLAEVISKVKQLKTTAAQASEDLHIPMDSDEVEVTILENSEGNGSFLLKASLCCDNRTDLLSDLRQAISDLPLQILKSEISTLGDRLKAVLLITTDEENSNNAAAWEQMASSVRAALRNILDKVSASAEYAQLLVFPKKRPRVSYFDSSHSS